MKFADDISDEALLRFLEYGRRLMKETKAMKNAMKAVKKAAASKAMKEPCTRYLISREQ